MGVSGRHAHDVFRPITVEGLCTWRYNRGLCLAPDPKNPFANADFTNQYVEKQRGLLAPVTREHHPGSFSKTHLWHSLLTAKQSSFAYYDDGAPMVPNYSDPETARTLEEGLIYEELEYEAYEKHPNAIMFLMKGENADASMALGDTEMSLIRAYFETCKKVVIRPGLSLWQAADEAIGGSREWTPEFKQAACDFANLLGEPQMKVLVECYQYYVNPKSLMIGAAQLRAAGRMPARYPWCKIAPVIANLLTTNVAKDKIGSCYRGNAVPDASLFNLKTISSLGQDVWEKVEHGMDDVVRLYSPENLRGVDSHTALLLAFA